MAYIYPLNNSRGVHLTVFDFTHFSPPPTPTIQNLAVQACCTFQSVQKLFLKIQYFIKFLVPTQKLSGLQKLSIKQCLKACDVFLTPVTKVSKVEQM